MRNKVVGVVGVALVAACAVFSALRVASLTGRVRRLETVPPRGASLTTREAVPTRVPVHMAPPDGGKHLVLRVIDGDTVEMETDAGPLKVRIPGIDTPETVHPSKPVEPFGPEATAMARDLLRGLRVRIRYDVDPRHDTWDKYGRLLAYIELPDGRDFGLVMIREGMAKAYLKYPFSRRDAYVTAEAEAKENKRGQWAEAEGQ